MLFKYFMCINKSMEFELAQFLALLGITKSARTEKWKHLCDICQIEFDDPQERDVHMRALHYGEVE